MIKNTLTTYDIAQYAQVTPRTVIQWINDGKLKAYRTPGNHSRVSFEEFLGFLKKYNMPVPKELTEPQIALRKSILIVDDDRSMADAIRRLLVRDNLYDLDIAYDGFEAGEKFAKKVPDLIILDLNMPGVNGYQLTERIRKELKNNVVKILIVSAVSDGENLKRIIGLGADDFLVKPFSSEQLKAKMDILLKDSLGEESRD